MSCRPNLLGGYEPTLQGRPRVLLKLACVGERLFPVWNVVEEPARQAYSHSASVGKRYRLPAVVSFSRADSFLQNSMASAQFTRSTGKSLVSRSITCALPS